MEARVHLGHKKDALNPHMRPYVFGNRLGVTILDLDKTANLLNKALDVTSEIAYRRGIIMFVHQSRQTGHIVEKAAKECGEYAYCRRWINEVLTDSQVRFGAVTRLPDLIIALSSMNRVIYTSARLLIPTIAICDSNSDPTYVTYPVPGNDDTPQSIELYCDLFKTAILEGKARRLKEETGSKDPL